MWRRSQSDHHWSCRSSWRWFLRCRCCCFGFQYLRGRCQGVPQQLWYHGRLWSYVPFAACWLHGGFASWAANETKIKWWSAPLLWHAVCEQRKPRESTFWGSKTEWTGGLGSFHDLALQHWCFTGSDYSILRRPIRSQAMAAFLPVTWTKTHEDIQDSYKCLETLRHFEILETSPEFNTFYIILKTPKEGYRGVERCLHTDRATECGEGHFAWRSSSSIQISCVKWDSHSQQTHCIQFSYLFHIHTVHTFFIPFENCPSLRIGLQISNFLMLDSTPSPGILPLRPSAWASQRRRCRCRCQSIAKHSTAGIRTCELRIVLHTTLSYA